MIIKNVPKQHHQRLSVKGWRGTVSRSATDSRGENTVEKSIYCPIFFIRAAGSADVMILKSVSHTQIHSLRECILLF
jgi:hypothetical protein